MLATLQHSKFLFMCRRLIPVSDSYKGDSFFTMENGKKIATPLLLVLAVVELSDVVFAVDSIPAVSAARPALLLEVVLHVLSQYTICMLHVLSLCIICVLLVLSQYTKCMLHVLSQYNICVLHVLSQGTLCAKRTWVFKLICAPCLPATYYCHRQHRADLLQAV